MVREDEKQWEEELPTKRCYECDKFRGEYAGYQSHVRVFTEKYRNTANPVTDFEDICIACRDRPSNIKPLGRKRTVFDDIFG